MIYQLFKCILRLELFDIYPLIHDNTCILQECNTKGKKSNLL